MGLTLRDLLSAIGAEIESHSPPVMPDGTLQWIGRLTQAPRSMVDAGVSDGWEIWTSGPGWIPLEHLDIERWQVDITGGKHLVICEREEIGDISIDGGVGAEIVLWGPGEYAAFIGRAVLEGLVALQPNSPLGGEYSHGVDQGDDSSDESSGGSGVQEGTDSTAQSASSGGIKVESEIEDSATLSPMPPSGIDLAVAPVVDVQNLMIERGRSGISLRPIMLEAALWVVEADLIGPNQEVEKSRWWVIEDSLADECSICEAVDFLRQVPEVEVMPAITSLDESRIRSRLSSLLDIRRAEKLSRGAEGFPQDSHERTIAGGLLRWWRVDSQGAILTRRRLLLPAWIGKMPIDGIRIVHGLSGEEHTHPGNYTVT